MTHRAPFLFAAAAVVIAVGEVTDVQSVGYSSEAQVTAFTAAPGLLAIAGTAFIIGALLLVIAVASAWSAVSRRGAALHRAGLIGIGAGAIWYTGSRAASDIEDAALTHLPHGVALQAFDAAPSAIFAVLDPIFMFAWFLGPILLWAGARRARRAHWLLLVIYVVAVAVEFAFAFVSLPVEGVTALIAIGTIAAMTRTTTAPVGNEAAAMAESIA